MRLNRLPIFIVCILGLVVGCNNQVGPRKWDISGTIKMDGKEVTEGEVVFAPDNPSYSPEGGKIKDGKYTMKAREGSNKIEIRGTRIVPGKKGPLGEDWVEQFIPEKYNEATTLSAEVGSGKVKHDFDLTK